MGYLSIGISGGGSSPMTSSGDNGKSDILLGWMEDPMNFPNSKGHIADYNVNSYSRPILDTFQDAVLRDARYNSTSGIMRIDFERPLFTNHGTVPTEDRDIRTGNLYNTTLIWATNPNMGAVSTIDGSVFTKHLSNTRGSVFPFSWDRPSDCTTSCITGPRMYDLLAGECLANGWPSYEVGGDRDDGKAWPKLRILNPSSIPTPNPSPSPSSSTGVTPTPSISVSPSSLHDPCSIERDNSWPDARYNYSFKSNDNVLSIAWSLNTYQNETIINILSTNKGWMGIGWNTQNNGMMNADFIISWADSGNTTVCGGKNCNVHLTDRYAAGGSGHSVPLSTEHQDVTFLHACVTSSFSSVTFRRPLYTGESTDIDLSNNAAVYILWAYGTANGLADGSFARHPTSTARGSFGGGVAVWNNLAIDTGTVVQPSASATSSPSTLPSGTVTSSSSVSATPSPSPSPVPLPPFNPARDIPRTLPDANTSYILASPNDNLKIAWSIGSSGSYTAINLINKQRGWMAIGFNKDTATMTGMDSIVGWVRPKGTNTTCDGVQYCDVYVTDRYSSSRSMPLPDNQVYTGIAGTLHNNNDILVLDAYVCPEYSSLTILRPLVTSSINRGDYDLRSTAESVYILWAYGSTNGDDSSGVFYQHAPDARGSTVNKISFPSVALNEYTGLRENDVLQVSVSSSQPVGGYYALHGAAMVCGFWIFMTIAAWIGRYRNISPVLLKPALGTGARNEAQKWETDASSHQHPIGPSSFSSHVQTIMRRIKVFHTKQFWFLLHIYLHTAGLLSITIGLIAIKIGTNADHGGPVTRWSIHQQSGTVALIGAYGQYILGLVRPDIRHPWRNVWVNLHRTVALLIFFTVFITIPTGMSLSGLLYPSIMAAVVIHVLCAIGFTLVMEMEVHSLDWLIGSIKNDSFKPKLVSGSASTVENDGFRAKNIIMNPLDSIGMNSPVANGLEEGKLVVRVQQSNTPGTDTSITVDMDRSTASSSSPPSPPKPKGSSLTTTSLSTVGRNMFLIGCGLILILDSSIISAIVRATTTMQLAGTNTNPLSLSPLNRTVTGDTSVWITNGTTTANRRLQSSGSPTNATYSYQNITDGKYPGGDNLLCFHMYNYEVPPEPTSYSCRAFAFPNDVELHAVEFIPMIDNAAVTHHMLLLGVDNDYSKSMSGYTLDSRGVFRCETLPVTSGPLFVWALGSQNLELPSNVGTRVGTITGSTSGSYKYVVLQIHYSNPSGSISIFDNSGVAVRVTNRTRPYDSGLLMIGAPVDTSVVIPPNKTAYGIQSHLVVPSNLLIPRNVFAVMYHAHTLGKRVWADLIRGGNQLITGANGLGRDDPFDFGMQRYLPLNASFGGRDVIRTRCVFENTVARGIMGGNSEAASGRPVTGGEGTTQEMCMTFLFYYPRIPVAALSSSVLLNVSSVFCDDDTSSGRPACSSF